MKSLIRLFLPLFFGSMTAATLPAGFSETNISGNVLTSPTAFAIANDGRIFVCEQGGTLRVIKNGAMLPTPFLTVAIATGGERGLLGIAFDPNFASNQFVYIYYTAATPVAHNRISRFTANGDVADASGETIIFDLDPSGGAQNHNGGAIHFGPDGKLYAAVGDNTNGANAQTLANLHGKILRINPDGSIPSDNPFYLTATNEERAIWALGLRNPFTFAFQPGTGRMFINDVGEVTWEEINDGIAASNYGWPDEEGPPNPPPANPAYRYPLFYYGHGGGPTTGCAITGGAFYNPTTMQFPASYANQYFFADYCSGWIRLFNPSTSTASDFASGISLPVDLHVAADGSLYYLSRGSGSSGSIRRVVYGAAQRTFVSASIGNDANLCTRSSPCRQFAAALGRTSPGGEVVVLDSGGYGPATIRQAVSVVAPAGVHAAITAFSGNAVTILVGATDTVTLRGLYLNGLGGDDGIHQETGQTLHVENCVISGFAANGLFAGTGDVFVHNVTSRQNYNGFRIFNSSGAVRANLFSIRAEENLWDGVSANAPVTVTKGTAAGNGRAGFYAGGTGTIHVESCTTTLNLYGVYATSGQAFVANTMITGNTTGVAHGVGGSTISYGNNGLHGNGTDGAFATTIPQQ